MKLIKANYEIITPLDGDAILKHIEQCARECYQSSHKITEDSAPEFVRRLISSGHTSTLEHFSFTVHFEVDRGVTHEFVRHRFLSPSQESTRYCNYSNDRFDNEIKVIDIREGIKLDTKMKDMSIHLINAIFNEWMSAMEDAERHYNELIRLGATPQIARGVLPNSLKSGITLTANLREWMLVFTQRTALAAHPQMREVMIPLLAELKTRIPVVFDHIKITA